MKEGQLHYYLPRDCTNLQQSLQTSRRSTRYFIQSSRIQQRHLSAVGPIEQRHLYTACIESTREQSRHGKEQAGTTSMMELFHQVWLLVCTYPCFVLGAVVVFRFPLASKFGVKTEATPSSPYGLTIKLSHLNERTTRSYCSER